MKLLDILFENDDQDQGGVKGLRFSRNVVLQTTDTPLSKVENALEDLNNYGEYKSNQQNINVNIQQEKVKFFGPPGAPPTKIAKAKKDWNEADVKWKKIKAKEIQSRTGIDTTGWEELSFGELPFPEGTKKDVVFYNTRYNKQDLDDLITSLTSKADILHWVKEDDMLVFPREANKNVPNDVTLEKILKTVMANAGITDYKIGRRADEKDADAGEKSPEIKRLSKFTQIKISLDTRADAAEVRKELQAKFIIPQAAYDIKETEDGFDLIIRNITITQKANIQNYLQDEGLLERLNEDIRRMLVLAGIIK